MRRLGTIVLLAALACIACPAARAGATDFPSAIPAARKANPGAAALLIVHYRRAGGDYDGWNLWAWPSGGDGGSFTFSGTDAFGRYAVVPFAGRPDGAGFLVRRGNWEAKDVDGDRTVSFADDPVQEIWLLSGDTTVHRDPSAIDLMPRVRGAFLDGSDRVTLATTQPLSPAQRNGIAFTLRDDARNAPRCARIDGPGEGGVYTIKLSGKVKEADVAALQLRIPELNPVPVFARGVLDQPSFTPLDAKLGAMCTPASTTFTTWSPVADSASLLLFGQDLTAAPREVPLTRGARGLWSASVDGDLHGTRYRYRFRSYGKEREVPDIHCVAATADSAYSVVADLVREEPAGWKSTPAPTLASPADEVIYEIHVRDYSVADPACPPELRGTYLGIAQPGASKPSRTGLAHLKDLGVTAVHLLPIHDFTARPDEYNWGYWTALFNVPESNYASRKGDPLQPVRELREAIQSLHQAGIRVILDVVYNHTSSTGEWSPFDQTVPFYYHRTAPDGSLLNDAGVGNCIADERPMMRKYILDSLEHWTRNYRVDGFRFDLVGTHTPETVKAVCERLLPIRGDLTLYGEPWTGGGPIRFGKGAQKGLRFAVFNDHLRNAIRGDLDGTATGFATGPGGDRAAIQRGVSGAIDDFAREPIESVAYVSAHDNLTLWDKLVKAQPQASDATRRAMQKLALGVVLTSQGIAFLHGGCDFARTKSGNHNSYDAGDQVNRFDWDRKAAYADVHDYARGLVALRRAHPAFRMDDDEEVRRAVRFLDGTGPIAFTIDGAVSKDPWNTILVAYNGEPEVQRLAMPGGDWEIVVNAKQAGVQPLGTVQNAIAMPPYSMIVARRR